MEAVGFKEWALVCQALGEGKQNVIIRKGGIAEGRDGFAFRHREFFLFPTFFHEQLERVRVAGSLLPEPRPGEVEIRWFARVKETWVMTNWEEVRTLEPLHIFEESVVRERFGYDAAPGVHVAFVEVLRLEPVWRFPDAKAYGGCRSWVKLPDPPADLKLHAL
jgi:hypothetical protein